MSFPCYTCPNIPKFKTIGAFRAHSGASVNHSPWSYCDPCSRKFLSESALEAHLNDYHRPGKRNRYTIDWYGQVRRLTTRAAPEPTQFHCCDCDKDFCDEKALDNHLRDKVHTKESTTLVGFLCKECNRTFRNDQALQQHLVSVKHKPLIEELKCITGSNCEKRFTSPSAMLHHLESGGCKFGIDRRKIDQIIKEKDTGGIITSEAGLEGRIRDDSSDSGSDYGSEVSSSSSSSTSGVQVYTPTSSTQRNSIAVLLNSPGGIFTPGSGGQFSDDMEALAIVEGRRKCPMCPPSKTRTYDTADALRQHMTSAAHAPLIYHCPLTLATGEKGSIRAFTTLSGMTQHLESGACKGGKNTFRKAVTFVNAKLRELGFADMKLIS